MRKRDRSVISLDWRSILDERPKAGQFVLIAWDINGYCGFESTYWDTNDFSCKAAVMWTPLIHRHTFGRQSAVLRRKKGKYPLLDWSEHFSRLIDKKYVSKSKIPKPAERI